MERIDFSQYDLQGITLQDFDFMQNAYKDSFNGLSTGIGNSYILSGCSLSITIPSAVDVSCTAGYIVLDGEVVKVDAFTVTVPTLGDVKWKVEESTTLPSPSLFGDSSLRDVHFKRRAIIDATGTISAFAITTAQNLIKDIANPSNSTVPLTLSSEWEPGAAPVVNPCYRIDGKTCHLLGDIRYKVSSPPVPTIPFSALVAGAGLPLTSVLIGTIAYDWDSINNVPINIEPAWIKIDSFGTIILPHGLNKSISLNCSYPIA